MAITNAQQYKQLVNPPMKGNKRPGYRGEAAAASDRAAGRNAGRSNTGSASGRGDGPSSSGPRGRDPSAQFKSVRPTNIVDEVALTSSKNPNFMRDARRAVTPLGDKLLGGLPFGVGITGSVARGFLNLISPSPFGYSSPKAVDLSGEDNGEGQNIIPLIATPYQQDIVEEAIEELSPIELALKQRDELGGARAFAKEGGIMDIETGRQMYLFGKLVKKAKKIVGKITKSPIGKAALAFGAAKLGGGLFGTTKFGFMKPGSKFLSKVGGLGSLIKQKATDFGLYKAGEGLTGKGMLGLGAALTAAPLLFQKDNSEDEYQEFLRRTGRGPSIDIQGIRNDPYSVLARGFYADGGIMRLGFDDGDTDLSKDPNYKGWKKMYETNPDAAEQNENHKRYLNFYNRNKNAQAEGSKEPVAKKTLPLLDMGGQEMDLRAEGGFVPIGRMEKADDVPARLSKNEFVFTADAVRNAGDGNVDKGAEVMYNMMKNLEAGGEVSEESQGLKGARKMFQTSQRLEEVL